MKRPLIVLALLGEMLLSGSTQAYDVMVVKSEYQAHDKSGGGCFYGYGVDKLEYQVEVGAFDALMFKKTDAFVVDLTEYLKENIFEDRCGPTIG